ncbi:MAG: hypothetical protein ACE5FH_06020 [Candidatus Zixiibacteriota bacterium]
MIGKVRQFKETVELRASVINRLRSHRYSPVVILILAVLLVGCLHIWQRVQVLELVREVAALEADNSILKDQNKKAYVDIAALSLAKRIQQIAIDSLGMEPISADRLYTLERSGSVAPPADELAQFLTSLKRLARYLPSVEQTRASAAGSQTIEIEPDRTKRGGQ